MSFQNVEDRRKHKRILLPEHQFLVCKSLDPKFDGKVSVIGTGGLFVRTRHALTMGQTLHMRIEDPSLTFEVQCTVRDVNEKGVGVEFAALDQPQQRILQEFLRTLRP